VNSALTTYEAFTIALNLTTTQYGLDGDAVVYGVSIALDVLSKHPEYAMGLARQMRGLLATRAADGADGLGIGDELVRRFPMRGAA